MGFAFFPWVSVCVFVSQTHAGVSIYLTHAWVLETNTHTETQAKPTLDPGSQLHVNSFQGKPCMLLKPFNLARASKKFSETSFIENLLDCPAWVSMWVFCRVSSELASTLYSYVTNGLDIECQNQKGHLLQYCHN